MNADNVVYHGIDVEEYPVKEEPDKGSYLFTIGRVTRDKGQNKAIEIAKKTGSKLIIAGCARYQNDVCQRPDDSPEDIPSNPWFISTLWLAEYYIARAENLQELRKAIPYLEWCTKNALPSGVLAEQVHPANSSPLSVSPLTWSHSSFVWTVELYTDKFNSFVVNKTASCNLEDYQTQNNSV